MALILLLDLGFKYLPQFHLLIILSHAQKNTPKPWLEGVSNNELAMTYSHMGNPTLPSAQRGFTSEFGKGSGGSLLLLSPAQLFMDLFGSYRSSSLAKRCFSCRTLYQKSY